MMYQPVENPEGEYIGADGKHYDLLICEKATGPDGVNIGWKEYKTLRTALKYLELTLAEERPPAPLE